jgi:hypothetical protein
MTTLTHITPDNLPLMLSEAKQSLVALENERQAYQRIIDRPGERYPLDVVIARNRLKIIKGRIQTARAKFNFLNEAIL